MNLTGLESIFSSLVAGATPILIAAIGETLTEKAGVINLSLDGTILLGAMISFVTTYHTGSLGLGFFAGALVGAGLAAIIAGLSLFFGASQVAVGFVLTLLARDLAYFFGSTYARISAPQIPPLPIPYLSNLPVVGPIFFNHNILVYWGLILIPLATWFLYYTNAGLILRAAGENPKTCFSRGINARFQQLIYSIIGGSLVGFSGAAFALCFKPGWGQPQGAEGTGWIVLALVIFGGWHPVRACLGAYLFAFLQIASLHLQNQFESVPAQVFQVAPFPLMIFSLLLVRLLEGDSHRNLSMSQTRSSGFWQKIFSYLTGPAPSALGKPFSTEADH